MDVAKAVTQFLLRALGLHIKSGAFILTVSRISLAFFGFLSSSLQITISDASSCNVGTVDPDEDTKTHICDLILRAIDDEVME